MHSPNRALYYTTALVLIFVSVLASIVYTISRVPTESQTVLIAGIFTFATPTIAAILVLLQSLNTESKVITAQSRIDDVDRKVDGNLTKLVDRTIVAEREAAALKAHVVAKGDDPISIVEIVKRVE